MHMINYVKILGLLFTLPLCFNAHASELSRSSAKLQVISSVKKTEQYIKKNGIKKAIYKFKNSNNMFIGDYNGIFYVSPLHPELIGKSQFNYKDPTGALVVQEEIQKAKNGGGWLKGRWRKNPQTGEYQCRKIFILPVTGNYFIGSWYHYTSNEPTICLS